MDKEIEKTVIVGQMDFYTLEQLSERLGTTTRHLQTLISNNKLKAAKVGKRLIVLNSDVIEFLKSENDKD